MVTEKISFCEGINLATKHCMREDPSVFCYGIGAPDHKKIFGTTEGLIEEFGVERCLDTPIAEDSLAGFGLGACLAGLRPVNMHIRVDFLILALNQILNGISGYKYGSLGASTPITFRGVVGRGWGQGYQHSKSLHSIFAHIPGLEVYAPTTVQDAYAFTKSAIESDCPSIILEHRWLYWQTDSKETVIDAIPKTATELGYIEDKPDVVVVTTSWAGVEASIAKRRFAELGIKISVISQGILHEPVPNWVIEKVSTCGYAIVADNDWAYSGFGSEIACQLTESVFTDLKKPVKRMGWKFSPCPTARHLENEMYLDASDIVGAIGEILGLPVSSLPRLTKEELSSHENKFRGPF